MSTTTDAPSTEVADTNGTPANGEVNPADTVAAVNEVSKFHKITPNVPLPVQSRIFAQSAGRDVIAAFDGIEADEANGVEAVPPAETVGFGDFASANAARSAGASLNKLIHNEDPTRPKYSVRVVEDEENGKPVFRGIMLNKAAKAAPVKADNEADKVSETPADAPTPVAETGTPQQPTGNRAQSGGKRGNKGGRNR
jgi:hypothetical protein